MDGNLLAKTLDAVATERPTRFDRSFDLAGRLVAVYGEDDLASRLYRDIPAEYPWQVVADLFNLLIWSTADNGASLTRTTEGWLRQGDDVRKVLVALHLDVYPFGDSDEMERILKLVAARHPSAVGRCRELIASRQASGETR